MNEDFLEVAQGMREEDVDITGPWEYCEECGVRLDRDGNCHVCGWVSSKNEDGEYPTMDDIYEYED